METMNKNKALENLVMAARKARRIDDDLVQNGCPASPYGEIYGLVSDAIYTMLGEQTECFDESVTCRTLNSGILTDKQAADRLAREYADHHEATSFHIPDNAFLIISEAADERQVSVSSLAELTLNLWVLQHQYAKEFAVENRPAHY